MDDTTYELRVIDHEGLWFYVITRNGRNIVEVSRPYGPVFPATAKRECEKDGETRLTVFLRIQQQIEQEQTEEAFKRMQAVCNKEPIE